MALPHNWTGLTRQKAALDLSGQLRAAGPFRVCSCARPLHGATAPDFQCAWRPALAPLAARIFRGARRTAIGWPGLDEQNVPPRIARRTVRQLTAYTGLLAKVLSNSRQERHLCYVWDGTTITRSLRSAFSIAAPGSILDQAATFTANWRQN